MMIFFLYCNLTLSSKTSFNKDLNRTNDVKFRYIVYRFKVLNKGNKNDLVHFLLFNKNELDPTLCQSPAYNSDWKARCEKAELCPEWRTDQELFEERDEQLGCWRDGKKHPYMAFISWVDLTDQSQNLWGRRRA